MTQAGLTRRSSLLLLASALGLQSQEARKDWVCPMDPDVRSASPGKCPRCGMALTLGVPDRKEYPLEIIYKPKAPRPGDLLELTLRILDPDNRRPVQHFEIVHEKLIHLFLVSENLDFFTHVHPVAQSDGSFTLAIRLPQPGMYRLLADFYPSNSVPQLALGTIYLSGKASPPRLAPMLAPCQAGNLSAALELNPQQPLAGLESKLVFHLEPATGLQLYLGAWAHMLAASADLIDLLHVHPFLADGSGRMQFNLIFPRPGLYRIWTQFQRLNQVSTTVFTVPVRAL